jgi:hypothetical protein
LIKLIELNVVIIALDGAVTVSNVILYSFVPSEIANTYVDKVMGEKLHEAYNPVGVAPEEGEYNVRTTFDGDVILVTVLKKVVRFTLVGFVVALIVKAVDPLIPPTKEVNVKLGIEVKK